MNIVTYSPQDVLLTMGGAYVTGWNTLSITRDSNAFRKIAGIRGKHTRTRTYDSSATITLGIPQSSEWNDILSNIVTNDIVSGSQRIEVQLKDASGSSLFSSIEAYVIGYPDVTYDIGVNTRTWTIQCLSTSTYNVGGNSKPTTKLLDSAVSGIKGLFS